MTAQEPIGSGYGRESTATDVLDGVDLSGKYAVVTGGYSGLGIETTRALANAGADVLVPARRPDHARTVLDELGETAGTVTVAELDLGDQASVAAFVASTVAAGRPIDIVINNAAIMACPETRIGPGWEAQFGTNHLGHFAMTVGLWPLLVDGGARVVSLSSTGHKASDIRWDDMMFEQGDYDKWLAYGQAKTANALFALQLDTIGAPSGVRAFSVHPGGIMTELQRHLPQEEMRERGWIDDDGNVNPLFKSPEQGAATSVWAATSPSLAGTGGVYCEDCDIAAPTDIESPFARFLGVDAHATDPTSAERLWERSVELTGVDVT
ncbi:MAG: SDR family NAD(P)-dependent oxidoreductase [Ilumatobacter sp.]|nr:SDR family NAD(P)-dependent oxidoreductase [Ilumatobacter sp.]